MRATSLEAWAGSGGRAGGEECRGGVRVLSWASIVVQDMDGPDRDIKLEWLIWRWSKDWRTRQWNFPFKPKRNQRFDFQRLSTSFLCSHQIEYIKARFFREKIYLINYFLRTHLLNQTVWCARSTHGINYILYLCCIIFTLVPPWPTPCHP